LILDPVLASGRGDQFADEEMIEAMIGLLLPQTTRADTQQPGSAASGAGDWVDEDGERRLRPGRMRPCRLIDAGCEYVLVTGTHEGTPQVVNTLYGSHGVIRTDRWDRLPGSYHGSGCTLASAIAAHLAMRRGHGRGGHGRAGIHLAHPGRRLSAGHGAIHSGPAILVAGRG
jgi:hydroxymethylpyrimidine/phosphomethylpyrimidine kinase